MSLKTTVSLQNCEIVMQAITVTQLTETSESDLFLLSVYLDQFLM